MARYRTIKADISEDVRFEHISEGAMLLFLLLKPHADDNGIICIDRMQILCGKAYLVREDMSSQIVKERIAELERFDWLRTFTHNGSKYAALDFQDERIDKPRPGLLGNDNIRYENLASACGRTLPKAENTGTLPTDSGTFATNGGTFATDAGTFATDAGTFANDAGTFATDAGTFANESGTFATDAGTFANESGTFANDSEKNPPRKERKGEGKESNFSSSSPARTRVYAYAGTGTGTAGNAAAGGPVLAQSKPQGIAPQERLLKPANGAGTVDREIPQGERYADELMGIYLSDAAMKKTRDELMMGAGIAEPRDFGDWAHRFSRIIIEEGRGLKTYHDYCSHFSRWLKTQPTHQHPNPKTLDKQHGSASNAAGDKTGIGGRKPFKAGTNATAQVARKSKDEFLAE